MAYATVQDVQDRMTRTLEASEQDVCSVMLDDAAVLIEAFTSEVNEDAAKVVSCRMVIRALGDGTNGVPMGATQGSQSALGYSQSWTIGSGGSVGELYLSKTDKVMLGSGNQIGSYSPVESLVRYEWDNGYFVRKSVCG